jgi:selenocysteine-specific translation elongation factor
MFPCLKHPVMNTLAHLDHDKTALIKRLTGVYMDRFKEENAGQLWRAVLTFMSRSQRQRNAVDMSISTAAVTAR